MGNYLIREWNAFKWLVPHFFLPVLAGALFFITILLGAFAQGSIGATLW